MTQAFHSRDILDHDGEVVVTLTGFIQECDEFCNPGNCEGAHDEHFWGTR